MGRDMPASGGNPSLTDQDLRDVAAYLKSLN
jgi:cytochrome c1